MTTVASAVQVLLSSCPDEQTARGIADALVAEHLAACVTILPGAQSVYRWRGQVERAAEHVLLIKAPAATYPMLERRLLELHPYDVPELLVLPVHGGHLEYLRWLEAVDD